MRVSLLIFGCCAFACGGLRSGPPIPGPCGAECGGGGEGMPMEGLGGGADHVVEVDAGDDAGVDAGASDAGRDGGAGDGGIDDGASDGGTDGGVTRALVATWKLKGEPAEMSVGAVDTGGRLLWLRYMLGFSSKIASLTRADGSPVNTTQSDLAAVTIVGRGTYAATVGRGNLSSSDWRVLWIDENTTTLRRSDSMNVVLVGGTMAATMFDSGAGPRVQVMGCVAAGGPVANVMVAPDGGVQRAEHSCGPTVWWDAATSPDNAARVFLGAVQELPCNLGDDNPLTPPTGQPFLPVLVKHAGATVGGVPLVRTIARATNSVSAPMGLGLTDDSAWVAYVAKNNRIELQRYALQTLTADLTARAEAIGPAFVPNTSEPAMVVADVLPHPTLDRVYLLVNVRDRAATFDGAPLPVLSAQTVVLYTFDRTARLLRADVLPGNGIPKSGSTLSLMGNQLIIAGQCERIPLGSPVDPLCSTTPSDDPSSFALALPLP